MSTDRIKFNVARIVTCSEVEGPFKRLAIWFQGCDIHCLGCCNPELQEFCVANILTMTELLEIILHAQKQFGIEGVTFCGGEPSMQRGLNFLGHKLRELGLGTILFSGHLVEDLPKELVDSVDMIIDGPFQIGNLDRERRLVGSTNQRLLNITGRYVEQMDWFFRHEMIGEVHISDAILMNGDALTIDSD